jgi:hypothetical protein
VHAGGNQNTITQEGSMKPLTTRLAAIALTGLLSISSFSTAQAQDNSLSYDQRKQVVQTYCQRFPQDPDCNGWWFWSASDYDRFYYRNRSDLDPLIAGIFGLAIGAIIGGAIANSNKNNTRPAPVVQPDRGHVARCYQRYKSYDERTDTFLGFDGLRHACNL